jgi:hypothetical protein
MPSDARKACRSPAESYFRAGQGVGLARRWLASWMPLKIAYLLMRWLFSLVALVFRGDRAKDAELLVCVPRISSMAQTS